MATSLLSVTGIVDPASLKSANRKATTRCVLDKHTTSTVTSQELSIKPINIIGMALANVQPCKG